MESNVTPIVVDTSHSPHTRLRPIPLTAISLADRFWAPRRRTNQQITLRSQFQHLEDSHRLDNFRRVSGKANRPFEGPIFNDTDVYKWLEAAAWTLATEQDAELEQMVDIAITEIADAQQPDGYVHSYYALKPEERWTNLRDMHELYNAGHLIQAAVAHYRATGSTRLLEIARRFADLICATFGPEEQGKRAATDGHEEIELALIELYRATAETTYRDQAQFFIDVRGYGLLGSLFDQFPSAYSQDDRPFRELETINGHAVRAVYYTTGAADLYAETGEPALKTALERLWHNMVFERMYVNGGIGARWEGEAFGKNFELPNERAYSETCAAIGSVMWNWRMLAITGEARFADLLEHTLYNGVLPGLSLDGQHYFYQNPLENDGTHRRQPWFGCACCPPNVARLLASLPSYFYSTAENTIWFHLYAEGRATFELLDRRLVHVQQHTRYPWDGEITLDIDGEGSFGVFLRIPAWCETGATLEINGVPIPGELQPSRYVELQREWQRGDHIRLMLPMPVRRVEAHPYIHENHGRVALMRGPLLYCIEQIDHQGIDLRDIVLPQNEALHPEFREDLLEGVTILRGRAHSQALPAEWSGQLYRTASPLHHAAPPQAVELVAIPYFAWANREAGSMRVWLRSQDV